MSYANYTLPPVDQFAIEQAGRYGLHLNAERTIELGRTTIGSIHDQIYYICPDNSCVEDLALCVSDMNGGNARIIDRIKGWGRREPRLAVNGCSVLVYYLDEWGKTPVLRIMEYETASGRKMGEHKVKADSQSPCDACCRERTLFFLRDNNLCSYDCGVGASVLYRKAKTIRELRVWREYVIFWAEYEKQDICARGWMAFHIFSGKVYSLDSTLSPEEVMTHPAWFDPDSPAYVSNVRRRKIVAFDPARDICWVDLPSRSEGRDVHYWRACGIAKWAAIPDLPLWRFDDNVLHQYDISISYNGYGNKVRYFDGERLYVAPNYYSFYSIDPTGNAYEWSASNWGHGHCERFYVFGDRLFIDLDTHGIKVYPATIQPSPPIMNGWFEAPPPEKKETEESFGSWDIFDDDDKDFGNDPSLEEFLEGESSPAPSDGGSSGKIIVKTLTASDVKYGILTFGAKFGIGQGLPITVDYKGRRYSGKTSKTAKGRVDGMKALFTDQGLRQGDVLTARYASAEGVIYLDKIDILL